MVNLKEVRIIPLDVGHNVGIIYIKEISDIS